MLGAALLMSCDKETPDNQAPDYSETDKELEMPANPTGDPLTPNESRAKLEKIGRELITIANPDRQKELLNVINEFYLIAEDLEIQYGEAPAKAANAFLQPMLQACKGNVKAAADYSVVKDTYYIGLDEALGIYTHNGASWTYEESDKVLELRFKVDGQNTVFSVVPSGQTYEYSVVDKWEGSISGTKYEDTYIVKVPGTINGSVTKGTETLASLSVNGQYKVGGQEPVFSDVKLIMGPYDITAHAYVGTENVISRVIFKVDGRTILNTKAEAKGNFNLDPDFYLNEDPEIDTYTGFIGLSSVEIVAKVLDLRLFAQSSGIPDFERNFINLMEAASDQDSGFSGYGTPYTLSQNHVKKMASLINNNITNGASYENGPVFAKVEFIAQYYDYLYFQGHTVPGYDLEPVLVFEDDGAKFSFYDFFDENIFFNVIDDYEALLDQISNCLDNIIG